MLRAQLRGSWAVAGSNAQGLLRGAHGFGVCGKEGGWLLGSAATQYDEPFREEEPHMWEKPHSWTWKQGLLQLGRNTSVCRQVGQFLLGRKGRERPEPGLQEAQQVNVKA